MNLSMKWLSDYIKLSVSPRDYAHAMTMSGSKVETYELLGDDISNVVVGRILSVSKHPNADKLSICSVDVGKASPLQIVTGAPNITEASVGAVVPVALSGSTLPGDKKIKSGKLRGELSEGMLCSLSELSLTKNDFPYAIEDGIFLIEEECELGQDVRDALGLRDTVVEFEITSNRPDCLSVLGLARETAATYGLPFKAPVPQVKSAAGDITSEFSVSVEAPDLCPRYIARMVKNVKIAPSPRWMRERLRAAGVRPINNVVDITNYVMLEYGQPLHAFDLRYLEGGKIVVRRAAQGEKITTLDSVDRVLDPSMLVIADGKKPVALAGIMGGENSEIKPDTTALLFESANFFGPSVRRTSRKLGMRTEASGRFEKGLDPQNTLPSIERACELIELLGAGQVVGGLIDENFTSPEPSRVPFSPDWINGLLGTEISREEMVRILDSLELPVVGDEILVPSFRMDVECKADVAEEIARIYGYDKIPTTLFKGETSQGKLTERQKFERTVGETLASQGLSEICTYTFISPRWLDKLTVPADSALRSFVRIANPIGEETSILRTTALPSMLETLALNFNHRNPSAALYELAKIFIPTGPDTQPEEKLAVTVGMYGSDFFELKGVVETLLDRIGIRGASFSPSSDEFAFHPGICARLSAGGREIGTLGQLHPAVQENYDIDTPVCVAELDLETLFALADFDRQYRPLPKFPAITRDVALVCDDSVRAADIERTIRECCGGLLESVELFDVYKGKQIPDGKKSLAYSLVLRTADRTLTDEECDGMMEKTIEMLRSRTGGTLRG